MLLDELFDDQNKLVLFDMDGVLAECKFGEGKLIAKNEKDFYFHKRPIQSVINVVKQLSKAKNVKVGVLSSCDHPNQKQKKLDWINKYVPFFDKNFMFFVVWSEHDYTKATRKFAKLDFLKEFKNKYKDSIYLIEDDWDNIKKIDEVYENVAHHVSEILK